MIRMLIVDEARLMCNVMAAVLQGEPDLEVVGYATSVEEAISQAKRCNCALVRTTLPNNGALELVRALVKADPAIKVLIMGLPESEDAILQYIEAGAAGYVLNDDSVDELKLNIRTTRSGSALISPQIAAALMTRVAKLAELRVPIEPEAVEELTVREYEVLDQVAQGHSNQEIANNLLIELGTVKNHVHSILRKLNVNSRRDAAAYLVALSNS